MNTAELNKIANRYRGRVEYELARIWGKRRREALAQNILAIVLTAYQNGMKESEPTG